MLVAVIGERWITSSDGQGGRRLDNPEDFVRMEIATALKREIWVIPVLVDGASIPRSPDLPDDLKPLARRNALRVSDTGFNDDCRRLVTAIEEVLEQNAAELRERQRLETERLEKERRGAEQREKDRLEAERLQKQGWEAEQREKQRLATEKSEKERLEAQQRKKERTEAERRERERLVAEQQENERLQEEPPDAKQVENERMEKEQPEKPIKVSAPPPISGEILRKNKSKETEKSRRKEDERNRFTSITLCVLGALVVAGGFVCVLGLNQLPAGLGDGAIAFGLFAFAVGFSLLIVGFRIGENSVRGN